MVLNLEGHFLPFLVRPLSVSQLEGGGCYWHLVGGGQGCCWASSGDALDSRTTECGQVLSVGCAAVETPWDCGSLWWVLLFVLEWDAQVPTARGFSSTGHQGFLVTVFREEVGEGLGGVAKLLTLIVFGESRNRRLILSIS